MTLTEYFAKTDGVGVLSTADGDGRVDAAIYSRPHVNPDGTVAFVMRDRLTHHNMQQNPSAVFLYIAAGGGYRGLRLYLEKSGEDTNPELLQQMTRGWLTPEEDAAKGPKFAVYFRVVKILELIGSEPAAIEPG